MQNFDNDFIVRLLKVKGLITQEDIDEVNRQRQQEQKEFFMQHISCKADIYKGKSQPKEFKCGDGEIRVAYPYEEFDMFHSYICYYACFYNDDIEIFQERIDNYVEEKETEESQNKKSWWNIF